MLEQEKKYIIYRENSIVYFCYNLKKNNNWEQKALYCLNKKFELNGKKYKLNYTIEKIRLFESVL